MSLSPGRLLVAGFPGLEPPPELTAALRSGELGGVVLFARNYEGPEQLAALTARLQAASKWPLLVAADQEGGKVQRFRAPFVEVPEMRVVGDRADPGVARDVGRVLGEELAAVGVNW